MKSTRSWMGALVMCFFVYSSPAHSLEIKDIPKIVPGAEMTLPLQDGDTYTSTAIKITEVGRFKDTDGSEWMRVDGNTAEGDAVAAYVDILDSSLDIAVVVTELDLDDLGADIDKVRSIAKARTGTLTFGDHNYQFSGFGRTVFSSSDATTGKAAYFIFQSKEDKDLSLMILNWGDRIEAFVNDRLVSKDVYIK